MWIKANRPDLDATKIPSPIDIAWAAGVYEGEGTCRLCGRTKRGLMLSVVQKDPEILYRLRDWFGGSVRFAKCSTIPAEQQCFVLNVCGDRARVFLAVVYQFLSVRRKMQVEETGALDFLGGVSSEGKSIDELKSALLSYYEADRKNKWASPEFRKTETFRIYNRNKTRKYRAKVADAKVVEIA